MPAFRLFEAAGLPPGFRYPDMLLRLAAGCPHHDIHPWYFVDAHSEVGRLARLIGRSDPRDLVPFASVVDHRKNVACFEGDDLTGDPPVRLLAHDDSAGRYASFGEWQKAVMAEAWQRRGLGKGAAL